MTTIGSNPSQKSASTRILQRGRRSSLAFRPRAEVLEGRVVLSTKTWTGLGVDANWMTGANWQGGRAPSAADALVFPAGAHQELINNNFPANTEFKSITISGARYALSGNAITLGNGGFKVTTAGANAVNLPIVLDGKTPIDTVENSFLSINSAISGAGHLVKNGKGELTFAGGAPNDFVGDVIVTNGALLLSKSAGVTAIPRHLEIQPNTDATGEVRVLADEQIDDDALVIVTANGEFEVHDSHETIHQLNLSGGKVLGTGELTLLGNLNASPGRNGELPTISVPLALGPGEHTAFVTTTLTIDAAVSDASPEGARLRSGPAVANQLIKTGQGTLVFSGTSANTYAGTTNVKAGTLMLSKPDSVDAVSGPLVVGQSVAPHPFAAVLLTAPNQIADSVAVATNVRGLLDLGTFDETFASLEMTGGTVSHGSVTLGGNVVATSGAQGGPATISAALNLGGATRTLTVKDGPASVDLDISGPIKAAEGVGLTKAGAGVLQFSGTSANEYTGWTTVLAGQLDLNKTGDATAVAGPLSIGAHTDEAPSAIVRLLGSNQIADTALVLIDSTGLLNLNQHDEAIGALTLAGGDVTTGAGVLTLGGDVTAISDDVDNPAYIRGKLHLGSSRVFNIHPGPGPQDLIVDGVISGESDAGISKRGAGVLQFAGSFANTYDGTTEVREGLLELNKKERVQAVSKVISIIGEEDAAQPGAVCLLENQQIADDAQVSVWINGLFDLNGHNERIAGLNMHGGRVESGAGILTPGTISAQGWTGPASISGQLNLAHGPRTINVTKASPATDVDLVIRATFLNGGSVVKAGVGTLLLAGDDSSAFTVSLHDGTLRVEGERKQTVIHIGAGTLEGTGTVKSVDTRFFSTRKLVRLGTRTTVGVLGASGDIAFSPLTTLEIKLKGGSNPTAGVDFDQLAVSGEINLNQAELVVRALDFEAPTPGTRFRIIENTSNKPLVGEFSNVPRINTLFILALSNGQKALFSVDYRAGSSNNCVDLVFEGMIV